jgi:hypothetical protein
MDMRLCITARGVSLEGLEHLEERLRLLLGSWTCRIRQARVFLEDVNGRKHGFDVRCTIEAELIPSGKITVQGWGTDTETALPRTARRLVRRVKRAFYRSRRTGQSALNAGPLE